MVCVLLISKDNFTLTSFHVPFSVVICFMYILVQCTYVWVPRTQIAFFITFKAATIICSRWNVHIWRILALVPFLKLHVCSSMYIPILLIITGCLKFGINTIFVTTEYFQTNSLKNCVSKNGFLYFLLSVFFTNPKYFASDDGRFFTKRFTLPTTFVICKIHFIQLRFHQHLLSYKDDAQRNIIHT